MVTNGMWETQGKVARLPEEDPQTFQSFLDWALSGIYRTREMARDERDDNWGKRSETGNLTYFLCEGCRKSGCFKTDVRTIIQCPACDAEAQPVCACTWCEKIISYAFKDEVGCHTDGYDDFTQPRARVCRVSPMDHYKQNFTQRTRYGVGTYNHAEVEQHVDNAMPRILPSHILVAHVEVFIFAEKYLITPLRELSLYLLHREMKNYEVPENYQL